MTFCLDALQCSLVLRICAFSIRIDSCLIHSLAHQVHRLVAATCGLEVVGKGPLTHAPVFDLTLAAGLTHASHIIFAPIRLLGDRAEILLHDHTHVVGPRIIVAKIHTLACAGIPCQGRPILRAILQRITKNIERVRSGKWRRLGLLCTGGVDRPLLTHSAHLHQASSWSNRRLAS